MIKYERVIITPVSNVETMASAAVVIGSTGKNKRGTGITTEPTATISVVAYRDTESICDIDSEVFDAIGFAPLDCKLGVGEAFKVGLWSTSGTTAQDVTVQYEESD